MSTNGTNVDCLREVLKLLDYVALDLKDASELRGVTNANQFVNRVRSQALLAEEKMHRENFDYELRTTLYPPFIDGKVLKELGQIVREGDKWILQQFRVANNMLSPEAYKVKPYDERMLQEMLKIAQGFTSKAELKYV